MRDRNALSACPPARISEGNAFSRSAVRSRATEARRGPEATGRVTDALDEPLGQMQRFADRGEAFRAVGI